jgi:hypothetical protein
MLHRVPRGKLYGVPYMLQKLSKKIVKAIPPCACKSSTVLAFAFLVWIHEETRKSSGAQTSPAGSNGNLGTAYGATTSSAVQPFATNTQDIVVICASPKS